MRMILACLIAMTPAVAFAGQPSGDPKVKVENAYADILTAAKNAKTQDKLVEDVTEVVDRIVDWAAFSRRTMSPGTWDEFSSDQKAKFIKAYKRLITRRYAKRFKPGTEFSVELRGATRFKKDGAAALVKTTVFTDEDGKRVGVDVNYHFIPSDAKEPSWVVEDIETDGVSRARTYRNKFKRIYQQRGFDALVKRIEKNANKK